MSITRKNLLASTALVAALFAVPGLAQATELDTGMTITGTDATGLVDSNGAGAAIAVTINSNAGAITLGADSTPSIDSGTAGSADPVTITVTTSGVANGVTFADDVLGAHASDVITINSTNDNLTFEGTVTSKGGSINMGSASANPALSVTFDTANNENLVIDAKVSAVDAGDTITMNVTNTDGTVGNTIGFSQAIGGTAAIDILNIGAATTTTFDSTVKAADINIASVKTTTFTGLVTGDIDFNAAGTVSSAAGVAGTVDNTTGGDGVGTLTLSAHTADVTGAIGATNTLLAVNATNTGGTTAFGGAVKATTITLAGTGTTTAAEDMTGTVNLSGNSTLTVAANKKIVGVLNNTSGGEAGTINFGATTVDGTVLVSGAVGAANKFTAVTVAPTANITAKFASTYAAATTTHSGAGTVAFGNTVAGNVNISNGGTVTAAGNITGNVDNTSGTAGRGVLTLADGIDVTGDIGATKSLATVNLTNTAGTALAGNVKATNINMSGTGTTTSTLGDLTGTVNFKAANTLLLNTANQKIVGSVTTATNGTGTLTFAQNVTTDGLELVSGDIGSGTAALLELKAKAAAATEASFGGDVYAKTITLTGAASSSEFTFDGDVTAATGLVITTNGTINIADGKNLTAPVTTTVAGAGILNFAGDSLMTGAVGVAGTGLAQVNINGTAGDGIVTFSGDIAATTTTVAAPGTLKTDGAATITGAVNNSGTIDLGGKLTSAGTINLGSAAGATLKLSASSYTGGVVIDSSGQTINVSNAITLIPHASFTSGTITLIDTNAGAGTADDSTANFTVSNNALATYAVTVVANDVKLTATARTTAATAAQIGVTADEATALQAGVAATDGDATLTEAYNTAIQAGGAEAQKAAEESTPTTVAPVTQVLSGVARGAAGSISDRMASVRTGTQYASLSDTGVAAGSKSYRNGGWAKAFGGVMDQGDIDGASGYDSSTFGLSVGADTMMTDTLRMGIAGSYARANIEGKGFGNSDTDIDAFQFSVYGSYEPGQYFIEGQLGYAYNQIDTERTVDFGGLNRIAKGDYDANQFSMKVDVGMPIATGELTFIPKAGLFYSYSDADSYTETGAGGLNLTVDPGDHSILEANVGGSVSLERKVDGGTLRPEARAALLYEFLDDDAAATSRYTGAATTFSTKGLKPSQLGGTVGLGVGYSTDDGVWDLRVDYDAEMREEAVGHSGMLTGRMNF